MKLPSNFKPSLVRWQLRQLCVINVIAVIVSGMYVLLRTKPLIGPAELPVLMAVFMHGAAIVWVVGRIATRHTSFLYLQGFSRDQLWWNTWLSSFISGLLVCIFAWLLMATGLRCGVQDRWFQNMYFPFIAPEELSLPLTVFFAYLAVLPLMHFVRVRANQPCSGGSGGWTLMVLGLSLLLWTYDQLETHRTTTWLLWSVSLLYLPAAALLTRLSCRLHRSMEVRP